MKVYYFECIHPTPPQPATAWTRMVMGPCRLYIKDDKHREVRTMVEGEKVYIRWDMREVNHFRMSRTRRGKSHKLRLPPLELSLE